MSCSFHIFTTVHDGQRAQVSEVTKATFVGGQLPSWSLSVVNGKSRVWLRYTVLPLDELISFV